MDRLAAIQRQHVEAALALWRYCADSAECLFGGSTGDPVADQVLVILEEHPEGVGRTLLHRKLGWRNAWRIQRAVGLLTECHRIRSTLSHSRGRPLETYFLEGAASPNGGICTSGMG